MPTNNWTPDSWTKTTARQQPGYDDPKHLQRVLTELTTYPPLVVPGEIEKLREKLAAAAKGQAFILQGGNCAERFVDCRADSIANKLKILLQMSVILTHGVRKPVVRIGRMAGQYAKPRSSNTEVVDGQTIPSYRGDAINAVEPTMDARRPDPDRLTSAYFYAATVLNHLRSLIDGGFADLHHAHAWDMPSIEKSQNWPQYRDVVDRILDAIDFMESMGGVRSDVLGRVDFFTSHEALLLGYEQALTRKDPATNKFYNLGAHMLWIGARTRDINEAHVEYCRGIANPIGIKIDTNVTPDDVTKLIDRLNPDNTPGRITLITRLGAKNVTQTLPPLINAVNQDSRNIVWSCDPMHGNTEATPTGRKTRAFTTILDELRTTFQTHRQHNSHLAGVHFELTADDVTECTGGPEALTTDDLERRYETYCDPRLNSAQSLEMAFLIAQLLRK